MKLLFSIIAGFLLLNVGCAGSKTKSDSATPAPNSASSAMATAGTAATAAQEKIKGAAKAAVAKGTTATAEAGKGLTCKAGAEVRNLEVEATGQGCTLWYTKAGNRENIASSVVGSAHCEGIRDRIKAKLEEASYKCE